MKNVKNSLYKFIVLVILNSLFTLGIFAINPPTLQSPANNETSSNFTVALRLNSVSGAEVYQIQYDSVPTFNSAFLVSTDTFSNLSFTIPYIRKGIAYHWRARSIKQGDTSAWSASRKFSLRTSLSIIPSNGSIGDIRQFFANWDFSSDYPVNFIFEADTSPLLNSPLKVKKYQTQKELEDSTLFDYSRTIFWKGAVWSPLGDTIWSLLGSYSFYSGPTLNNSNSSSTEVIFSWSATILSNVVFQLDTTEEFNSPYLNEKTYLPGVIRDTIRQLLYGKKYFYRIKGEKYGKSSDWSAVRNFTVISKPLGPKPTNNEIVGSSSDPWNFSWINTKDSFSHVIIASDSSFQDVMFDSVLNNRTYVRKSKIYKLSTTYYWKVRHFHSKDTSDWTISKFRYFNGSINLLEPSNNVKNTDVLVNFRFRKRFDIDNYILEIDTGIVFNSTLSDKAIYVNDFIQAGSSTTLQTNVLLKYGTSYVWRVRSIHLNDTSLPIVLDERKLTTRSLPIKTFPSNNFEGIGTSTNGLIDLFKGTSYVEWQIDTQVTFQSPHLQTGIDPHVPDGFSPTKVRVSLPENLLFEAKYFWRVRCISDVDTSDWTTPFNFTTTQVPWLVSPANNATNISLTPTLDWGVQGSNASQFYQYQLATDPNFSSHTIITLPANNISEVKVSCSYSTKYYWRARAFHSRDTSSWSLIYYFTTLPAPIPPAPSLISPAMGEIVPFGPIGFYSRVVAGAHTYDFEVSLNEDFSNSFKASNSVSYIGLQGLIPGTKHFWRARAHVDTFVSPWSNVWWFVIDENTNVAEIDINDNLVLFPVPASSEISVKADLPFDLEMTSLDGRIVYKDTNAEVQKTIDVNHLPNGVYFIKINSNGIIRTRKIIIQH